jgi:hypothetical protein
MLLLASKPSQVGQAANRSRSASRNGFARDSSWHSGNKEGAPEEPCLDRHHHVCSIRELLVEGVVAEGAAELLSTHYAVEAPAVGHSLQFVLAGVLERET